MIGKVDRVRDGCGDYFTIPSCSAQSLNAKEFTGPVPCELFLSKFIVLEATVVENYYVVKRTSNTEGVLSSTAGSRSPRNS